MKVVYQVYDHSKQESKKGKSKFLIATILCFPDYDAKQQGKQVHFGPIEIKLTSFLLEILL